MSSEDVDLTQWKYLSKEKGRYNLECLSCNKLSTRPKGDLQRLCTCYSKNIGKKIGVWTVIHKGLEPAALVAVCEYCTEEKTKRLHEFKKYTCECKGYEKRAQLYRAKHKVDNPGQLPEVRAKARATMLDIYGAEFACQLPQYRNALAKWCEEHPEKLFGSKGELEVLEWIKQFYPSAQKMRKGRQELDIFIPELNLGIEYNGLFWHSEPIKEKNYHLKKTVHFEASGIRTIHIWCQEWKKSQNQVKSFLLSVIGKNEYIIDLKDCKIIFTDGVSEIETSNNLLDKYHLQECSGHTKYVANCYYKGELIATASFEKHYEAQNQWILSRFATKMNYTIRGALGKMSKMASDHLKQDIISWADRRLSQGNGYLKAGWQLEQTLAPDYFYCKLSTSTIVNKQRKHKTTANILKETTERPVAYQDGLSRVWDCGKLRFVYQFQPLK